MRSTRARGLTALVAILFVFGLSACGDDKPKPEKAGDKQEKKQAEPQKDKKAEQASLDEKKGSESGRTEAADGDRQVVENEGGAAEGVVRDDEGSAGDEAKGDEGTMVDDMAAMTAPLTIQRALENSTFYGVSGPLASIPAKVMAVVPQPWAGMLPGKIVEAQADILKKTGLKNIDWVDMERGMGWAITGKQDVLVAIPSKGIEAFTSALPDGLEPDDESGYVLGEAYLIPQPKFVLMTQNPRMVDAIEGDVRLEITRLITDKIFIFVIDGKALTQLIKGAFDEMEKVMGETLPMQQAQKKFIAKFFNFLKEMALDIKEIRVTGDLTGSSFVMGYEVEMKEGSKLADAMKMMHPGPFKTAKLLPSKSYMVMTQYVNPEVYKPWLPRYVDLMATAWDLSDEEKTDLTQDYAEAMNLMGPDASFSLYSDLGFPMAMTALGQSKDGMKMRDIIYDLYSKLFRRALKELPPDQQAMFANQTFKQIVDQFAPMAKGMGITLSMESEDYQGGKVDYLVMDVDWNQIPAPTGAEWLKDVIKKRFGFAAGFNNEYYVVTMGSSPIVRAKEVLDNKEALDVAAYFGPEYQEQKFATVFAISVKNTVDMLMELQVVRELIGGLPFMESIKQSAPILMTAEVKGTTFEALIHVDMKKILEVVAAATTPEVELHQ